MCDPIWLSEVRMRRIDPYLPLSHDVPRVDGRRIISGITFVIGNGLRGVMRPPTGLHRGSPGEAQVRTPGV